MGYQQLEDVHNNTDYKVIGGAIIAWKTKNLKLLNERDDLAILWDIRIEKDFRGRGLGTVLFEKIENWCLGKNCKELKVETQNINIGACIFYKKMGFTLESIDRNAYPDLNETQLIFCKTLS